MAKSKRIYDIKHSFTIQLLLILLTRFRLLTGDLMPVRLAPAGGGDICLFLATTGDRRGP